MIDSAAMYGADLGSRLAAHLVAAFLTGLSVAFRAAESGDVGIMPVKYAFALTFGMVCAIIFMGLGLSSLDTSIASESVVNGYAVHASN